MTNAIEIHGLRKTYRSERFASPTVSRVSSTRAVPMPTADPNSPRFSLAVIVGKVTLTTDTAVLMGAAAWSFQRRDLAAAS